MIKKAEDWLDDFHDKCIQCNVCLTVCDLLDDLGLSPGEIAEQVLSGQPDDETIQAVQRCALCGLCSQECLVNLNPAEMMVAAREVLVESGLISMDDYQVMQVDRDWNFFSIYRSTFGITYDDLTAETYDTLFFPGCSLASYAPELTRSIHAWLVGQGMQVGFTEVCCGRPLNSIGLEDRARHWVDGIRSQMHAAGAGRLVTACPNCHDMLQKYLRDVEIVSLYDLLLDAGVHLDGPERFTIHDSCPDRYEMETGKNVRALLAGHPLVEMEHHGADTICCGSGGIISMIDPELSGQRAERRMAEFADSGADRCVTACMACSHRLARSAAEGEVVNCLELVFNQPVDYAQIAANTRAMWEGDWGEYNLYRLSQAQIVAGKVDP